MEIIEIYSKSSYIIMKILSSDFSLHEVTKISSKTLAQLQNLNYPRTIVDLTGVQYIDTSGIGYLANMKSLLKSHSSELIIVCSNDSILDIMRIIKLNTLIKIFATLDAAEQFMNGN